MKIYRIYCYTNNTNGMKYIGCTSKKNQSQRSGKDGEKYVKNCSIFGKAITEFGWDNFQYEVLEDNLTKEQADLREPYWINELRTLYPNGYNLQSGGEHYKVHDLTKQNFSVKQKGHPGYMKGKKFPEEHNRRISETMKGMTSNTKGMHWYTNGEDSKVSFECPEGWWPGRTIIKKVI